jgi:hypothetical protein
MFPTVANLSADAAGIVPRLSQKFIDGRIGILSNIDEK